MREGGGSSGPPSTAPPTKPATSSSAPSASSRTGAASRPLRQNSPQLLRRALPRRRPHALAQMSPRPRLWRDKVSCFARRSSAEKATYIPSLQSASKSQSTGCGTPITKATSSVRSTMAATCSAYEPSEMVRATAGCWSIYDRRSRPRKREASDPTMPIETVPAVADPASPAARTAASSLDRTSRRSCRKRRPAPVIRTPIRCRSKRETPISSSRPRTRRLTADGSTPSWLAARRKPPPSATATKL